MGFWRNLAIFNAFNPDKVSPEWKEALHAKWAYDLTHPKKKSGLGGLVKSFVSIPFDAIRSLGRGDIGGLLDAGIRSATFGVVSLGNKGLLSLGAKSSGTSSSSGSAQGMYAQPSTSKQGGLVSQLRQGKGGAGGGSYTSVAKNPLGGESGKTGK